MIDFILGMAVGVVFATPITALWVNNKAKLAAQASAVAAQAADAIAKKL